MQTALLDPNRPVALVTGASSGVGAATARELSATHSIVALGRNVKRLAEVDAAVTLSADLRDLDVFAPEGGVAELIRTLPRLDALVHCAAVGTPSRFDETDATEWHRQFDTNVIAPALLTQLALPLLRASCGTVVFLGSGVSVRPARQMSAYAGTKHALKGIADSLRLEESVNGVRVTTVLPGQIDTPMQMELQEELGSEYAPEEYLRPESVAQAVVYAVSAPVDAHVADITIRPRPASERTTQPASSATA